MTPKNLKLEEASKQLLITKLKETANLELEEANTAEIDLSNQGKVNKQEQGPTIRNIYQENRKEKETLSLDGESQEEVSEIAIKSSKWMQDYKIAKSKLDSFANSLAGKSKSSKSSLSQNEVLSLSKKEREAIWEMYKLFEEIEKKQKKLVPRFNKIDNQTAISEFTTSRPNQSLLQTHLNQMNWTINNKVKFENPAPRPRWGQRRSASTVKSWDVWTDNPFQSFMSQEDYKFLIDSIRKTNTEKTISRRNDFRRRGLVGYVQPSAQTKRRETEAEKAKEAAANTVALKFLEWMGQRKQ